MHRRHCTKAISPRISTSLTCHGRQPPSRIIRRSLERLSAPNLKLSHLDTAPIRQTGQSKRKTRKTSQTNTTAQTGPQKKKRAHILKDAPWVVGICQGTELPQREGDLHKAETRRTQGRGSKVGRCRGSRDMRLHYPRTREIGYTGATSPMSFRGRQDPRYHATVFGDIERFSFKQLHCIASHQGKKKGC